MMNHLETYSILVDYQHGFRQERSSETQLVTFVNELLETMNNGIETDMIAMDLSKAFDTKTYGKNSSSMALMPNF